VQTLQGTTISGPQGIKSSGLSTKASADDAPHNANMRIGPRQDAYLLDSLGRAPTLYTGKHLHQADSTCEQKMQNLTPGDKDVVCILGGV
jgi:hypothetical protein